MRYQPPRKANIEKKANLALMKVTFGGQLSLGCQTSLDRSCSSDVAKRSYSRVPAEMGIASRVSVFRDGRKCWAVDEGGSSVLLSAPDAQ